MRSALIPSAVGACEWLAELVSPHAKPKPKPKPDPDPDPTPTPTPQPTPQPKPHPNQAETAEKSAEVQALNAAVRLFAAVFQLGTTDVRQQLLGHPNPYPNPNPNPILALTLTLPLP